MLGRHALRRRHGSHRFNALALTRHHQAHAIVPQWPCPIRVPDNAHDALDILRKSRFTTFCFAETHLGPHRLICEAPQYPDSCSDRPRLSDSVVLTNGSAASPAKYT